MMTLADLESYAAAEDAEARTRIIQTLFLCLDWEARQQAKRMLSAADQTQLAIVLGGEVNW